jgi:hypothetical protein
MMLGEHGDDPAEGPAGAADAIEDQDGGRIGATPVLHAEGRAVWPVDVALAIGEYAAMRARTTSGAIAFTTFIRVDLGRARHLGLVRAELDPVYTRT